MLLTPMFFGMVTNLLLAMYHTGTSFFFFPFNKAYTFCFLFDFYSFRVIFLFFSIISRGVTTWYGSLRPYRE